MKKIIGVIVVLVAGLLAYNFVTTGKFSLVPSLTLSEDERALKALEDRFHAATRQYTQAARTAGMSGLDTTADGEAALRSVERIEKDLRALRKRLSSQPAIQRAEHLATAIKEFSAKLG
jgi:phage-related tail protein